jgi:hypothetical protein
VSKTYTILPNPTPGSGLAFADAEIHLPSPVRAIALISSPSPDSNLYLHFMPLSKTATASPLTALGRDAWVPMAGNPRNFPVVRFCAPKAVFYLSGDGGASGKAPDFTLLCTDDIDGLDAELANLTQTVIVTPNPLPVTQLSVVDSANSTATPLLAGATFTGGIVDLLRYDSISLAVNSDKASAVNGLTIQFSPDGINFDQNHQFTFTATEGIYLKFSREARYYQVLYTNGATNQTFFRLQSILIPGVLEAQLHPIGELPDDNHTGLLGQSVIIGHSTAGGGTYVGVKVNPSGALTTETNLTQQQSVNLSAPIADAPVGTETAPVVRDIFRKKSVLETNTPLGGNGNFTGPWHDSELDGTHYVLASSFSNVAGANGALQIQTSEDQVHIQYNTSVGTGANTVNQTAAIIRGRYWRVIYVNGASAQASFSLYSCALSFPVNTVPTNTAFINEPIITVGLGAVGDNATDGFNSRPFSTSGFISIPTGLSVTPMKFGGSFSGTVDTNRQGWSKARTPTVFRRATTQTTGSTALWTPATNNKFRLLGYLIEVTQNAAASSAGVLTIKLLDSATDIAIDHQVFIPAAAGTTLGSGYSTGLIILGTFGILSAAANNVLNLNLSFALTAGQVNVIAFGTEE